jgi:hypothetical protein
MLLSPTANGVIDYSAFEAKLARNREFAARAYQAWNVMSRTAHYIVVALESGQLNTVRALVAAGVPAECCVAVTWCAEDAAAAESSREFAGLRVLHCSFIEALWRLRGERLAAVWYDSCSDGYGSEHYSLALDLGSALLARPAVLEVTLCVSRASKRQRRLRFMRSSPPWALDCYSADIDECITALVAIALRRLRRPAAPQVKAFSYRTIVNMRHFAIL